MLDKYKKQNFINYLESIKTAQIIKQKEILRICHLVNNSIYKNDYEEILQKYNFKDYFLEIDHLDKGKEYLIKKYLTKNKLKLRKNCYLSKEFQEIILSLNFDFRFGGFARISNGIWVEIKPIYICYSTKTLNTFEYFNFNGFDFEIDKPGKYLQGSFNVYYVDRI